MILPFVILPVDLAIGCLGVHAIESLDVLQRLHLKCRENTVKTFVENGYEKRVR